MAEAGTKFQPHVKRAKVVTLQPGRWIYICPCGFRYIAIRLTRTNHKMGLYCFKCKREIGKYYKIMDERLDFNENWNGKLNCQCFTVIRLHHLIKNCVGAIKQIYLKDRYKGDAKIMHVSRITLDQINLPMAKLDSGLLPDELRAKLREQYKNRRPNWATQPLDFLVLEYLKDSKEPTLF